MILCLNPAYSYHNIDSIPNSRARIFHFCLSSFAQITQNVHLAVVPLVRQDQYWVIVLVILLVSSLDLLSTSSQTHTHKPISYTLILLAGRGQWAPSFSFWVPKAPTWIHSFFVWPSANWVIPGQKYSLNLSTPFDIDFGWWLDGYWAFCRVCGSAQIIPKSKLPCIASPSLSRTVSDVVALDACTFWPGKFSTSRQL